MTAEMRGRMRGAGCIKTPAGPPTIPVTRSSSLPTAVVTTTTSPPHPPPNPQCTPISISTPSPSSSSSSPSSQPPSSPCTPSSRAASPPPRSLSRTANRPPVPITRLRPSIRPATWGRSRTGVVGRGRLYARICWWGVRLFVSRLRWRLGELGLFWLSLLLLLCCLRAFCFFWGGGGWFLSLPFSPVFPPPALPQVSIIHRTILIPHAQHQPLHGRAVPVVSRVRRRQLRQLLRGRGRLSGAVCGESEVAERLCGMFGRDLSGEGGGG